MTWCRRAGCRALGLALALLLAGAAAARAQGPIDVQVMVSRISDGPGGIDERAAKLHSKLQGEFRYESLEVLKTERLRLALDQVGTLALPGGKPLRVRPLQLREDGALLAVDVPGVVQTDLRVKNGHMVVIGAGRDGDGKLVISFEPRW